MANLAAANLLHRKTRTAVTALAVGVEVATVMLLIGLADGTLASIAARLESVGADVLFQPPDSSLILGVSSAVMPVKLAGRLLATQGVGAVAPVLNWHVSQLKGEPESLNLWAVDPATFTSIGGGLDIVDGKSLQGVGDIVVDRLLAESRHIVVGESVKMLDRDFRVSGISRPGSGGRIYARLADVGEALGNPDKASFFLVKRTGSIDAGELTRTLQRAFPGYKITSIAQVSKSIQDNAVGLKQFRQAITALAVVISTLVVLLAMYTAVLERTREIGILRALGATRAYIVRLVVVESALVCSCGVALGYLLAVFGRALMLQAFPAEQIRLTADWAWRAGALGLVGGVVGSCYPALSAARLDPISALSYE